MLLPFLACSELLAPQGSCSSPGASGAVGTQTDQAVPDQAAAAAASAAALQSSLCKQLGLWRIPQYDVGAAEQGGSTQWQKHSPKAPSRAVGMDIAAAAAADAAAADDDGVAAARCVCGTNDDPQTDGIVAVAAAAAGLNPCQEGIHRSPSS
eukprot:1157097-Pelagomonas_calceolata.AAC.10